MRKLAFLLNIFLCLSMAQAQTNLLSSLNGDFEKGNLNDWNLYARGILAAQCTSVISSEAHAGSFAAKVTWPTLNSDDDEMFNITPIVIPGQKLNFKAWAKSLSGTFMLRMHCSYFGPNGQVLGDYADESWILSNVYSEHTWNLPEVPNGTVATNIGFRAFGWNGVSASRFPTTTVISLIDDVRLLIAPQTVYSENLLTDLNGDFEKGNIDNWRFLQLGTTTTPSAAVMSADAHGGKSAAKVTWENFLTSYDFLFDVAYGVDPRQKLNILLPHNRTKDTKLVIIIPGGGWRGGDKSAFEYLATVFANSNIVTATINYRYANVENQVTYIEMLDDIDKAINFLIAKSTEYNFNPAQICLFGHSAGAHLSQLYAYRNNQLNKVDKIVSVAGTCDLTDPIMLNHAGMTEALTVLVNNNDANK